MATTKKTTAKKAATAEVEAKVAPKTTAKTAAKVAPVEEVKVEATVAEETPVKKTTAKKTTTATKKTTTRKTTAKKAVEPTVDFYVEYNGVQESYANVLENVKKSYLENNEGSEIKSVKVYLKPTENAAYCVINEEEEFRMDVFFC
ncbi:MAG: DUF6465 family protein [Acutalibacteraceae bacterium]|nr:DUF6465 family protein [Acutalibacteraceae bacterium]